MKKVIFILFLIICPLTLFSHDNSHFEFYGFSSDLKYCAFERYGTEDGRGYNYSTFYIIDVDKNEYAYFPIKLIEDDSLLNIRVKNLNNVKPIFEKLEISSNLKGTLVFYNIRIDEKKKNQDFTIFEDLYKLELIEKSGHESKKDDSKMFKLTISKDGQETVLQDDTSLPENRESAEGYRLVCAYYCYGKIAVFIEYEKYGFEGFDRRQMLVTGVLKTSELQMQYD